MRRVFALVLFAGGVLLISWTLDTAGPAPPGAGTTRAIENIEQAAPAAQAVDAEVDRLRARLSNVPSYPAPSRDPFRYGRRAPERAPDSDPVEVIAEVPAPPLPTLLAILTDVAGAETSYRAVIAAGRDVRVLSRGDAAGLWRVGVVSQGAVELGDLATGKIFRLALK